MRIPRARRFAALILILTVVAVSVDWPAILRDPSASAAPCSSAQLETPDNHCSESSGGSAFGVFSQIVHDVKSAYSDIASQVQTAQARWNNIADFLRKPESTVTPST